MIISFKSFAQLEYSDIPLSVLAGSLHGISEAYRLDNNLSKTVPHINSKWHTYSALSTMITASIPLDIYLTDENKLLGKAIRGYGDLVLYAIFSDGVMNAERGYNWFHVSSTSGWALEQVLNPQIKIFLLASYVALRILYENVWKEDETPPHSEDMPVGLR